MKRIKKKILLLVFLALFIIAALLLFVPRTTAINKSFYTVRIDDTVSAKKGYRLEADLVYYDYLFLSDRYKGEIRLIDPDGTQELRFTTDIGIVYRLSGYEQISLDSQHYPLVNAVLHAYMYVSDDWRKVFVSASVGDDLLPVLKEVVDESKLKWFLIGYDDADFDVDKVKDTIFSWERGKMPGT